MDAYIGTKIVRAEPMDEQTFRDQQQPGGTQSLPIRHGYKVVYEDGYTSWSPKAVFERCYRKITVDEEALIEAAVTDRVP